jgi:hypothetical protein
MLKSLRKLLEPDIFDIVVYGSTTKGAVAPRDIDVLAIFVRGTLRERLTRLQVMKESLKRDNLDMKQALLSDLFKTSFLARGGVMLEGMSVRAERPFSELMGFSGQTLFWWQLTGLDHTQKVKFGYLLAGRGMPGILEQLQAQRLVNGLVKVPIRDSLAFEGILKANSIKYQKKNILEQL